MDLQTFAAVPKAELHVHLEGAMRLERVLEFARQRPKHPWYNINASVLAERFRTASFPQFLEQFMAGYHLLRESHHYQAITEDLCRTFEQQGVVAADVLYSPGVHMQMNKVALATIHDGIEAGLAHFPNLDIRFIVDTVINLGFDFMSRTLEGVLADRRSWLAGFSVGGGDPDLDMTSLVPLFHRASQAGLFCVAHAGEVDGPENIAILLRETDVVRIGHGCAALRSPEVMDLLRDRGTVVDVSPTSNLFTGAVDQIENHPLKAFVAHGIRVTLNTDDPLYFDTDLHREYERVRTEMGFSEEQVMALMRDSLEIIKETR